MTPDFTAARQTMVDTQVRVNDVTDSRILSAMRAVSREAHCGDAIHLAYADTEVALSGGRSLLRPRDAGKLLQAVSPRVGDRALAISAPYLAAVLEALGLSVDQCDAADAVSGAYDVIVCEGAVSETPAAWRAALAPGGRLAVVERAGGVGRAMLYLRSGEGVTGRPVFDSAALLLRGFEPVAAFSL